MYLPRTFTLSIAGINLQITADCPIQEDAAFHPFLAEASTPDFRVCFRQVEDLPPFSESVLHEDACYRVHPDGKGGYIRTFFDAPRDMTPYAVGTYDYSRGEIRIDYLPKGVHCVSYMHNSFFHIGLEALLLHQNRLCLHASCVETSLGGILFSGVSGIGKTTQSDLWCQYRNAKVINGDRPILSREKDRWLAWGSPYAGSSGCHINEHCPITAIVMLKQEYTCRLRKLTPAEAFRAVWSGLTMHSWNEKLVETASDLTMELIRSVPVFEFGCTPDEQAVEYLENELRKECCL